METTIGKRISVNRKRLGLTQDQLAEKLGVTAQAVSKWENDQSCPDISVIPQLADIFEISTDTLFGRESVVHEVEIVNDKQTSDDSGFHIQNGTMEFTMDSGKKSSIGFAVFTLTVGVLYLISRVMSYSMSLWDILWPAALLVFGTFGLFPKFSFIRFGCTFAGGYFLLCKFSVIHTAVDNSIIFAAAILLFGLYLLTEALQKAKKPKFNVTYTDRTGKKHHGKMVNDFEESDSSFSYTASFGSNYQHIAIDFLQSGAVSTSFGEYTIDLTGVSAVTSPCHLDTECNFGELSILVPRRFVVKPASSTTFATFTLEGEPDGESQGDILLNAHVNFGEITVKYI